MKHPIVLMEVQRHHFMQCRSEAAESSMVLSVQVFHFGAKSPLSITADGIARETSSIYIC